MTNIPRINKSDHGDISPEGHHEAYQALASICIALALGIFAVILVSFLGVMS